MGEQNRSLAYAGSFGGVFVDALDVVAALVVNADEGECALQIRARALPNLGRFQ